MKQHPSIFTLAASLVCTLILALTACTPQTLDELTPDTDADARPLTISVTDGGMYSTPDPGAKTRAEERGYQTVFTEGDQIGLYVVKGGAVEKSNLCLTLRGGKWTLPANTAGIYYTPDKSFYAYYPYKDDNYMGNKISPGSNDFFASLVNSWYTQNNQSTYAAYTASDLMTARGEYSNGTLHFAMEHRMALLIVRFPTTLYKYTEQIGGGEIPKNYYRHTVYSSPCLRENPSTERILLNPKRAQLILVQHYLNGKIEHSEIKSFEMNLQSGKYTIHKIKGGAVTEVERPLKEGDYYMKDGSILPAEEADAMTNEDKKNCLGVVFWAGENEGRHWTLTGDLEGDRLLMRDHPGCVHGLVVALHDASSGSAWAEGPGANEGLYDWAAGFSDFTPEEQADWSAISESDAIRYGYCTSHIVKLYSAHHPDATFPAYNTINTYAALHPAPGSSSGWFLPAQGELAMMCYGKAGNYDQDKNTERRDLLNGLFQKAGGDRLEGRYWSTTDDKENVWSLNFNGSTNYSLLPKSDNYKVRAVLAF